MKLNMILTVLGLLAASTGWSADATTWKGDGVLFDSKANVIATYGLELAIKRVAPDTMETHVRVLKSDGSVEEFRSTSRKSGNGFVIEGPEKGGGYCFGEGLCQTYVVDSQGIAYATTVVEDGEDQMRLVRTELKGSEAIRFYREKLIRVR